MSGHRLYSPGSACLDFYSFTVCNEDERQSPRPVQSKNAMKLRNMREIVTSHNDPQISGTQNILRSKIRENRKANEGKVTVQKNCLNVKTSQNRRIEHGMCEHQMANKNSSKRGEPPIGVFPLGIPGISVHPVASHGKMGNDGTNVPKSSTISSSTNRITRNFIPESDSDSEDSDISDGQSLRKLEIFRLPYTSGEDIEILKYVMKNDNIERVGSLSLWRELESEKGEPRRTYQSLKNRFLRNIKPLLLTKYRQLLSKEHLEKVHRKFPELKKNIKKETVVTQVIKTRNNIVSREIQTQDLEPVGTENANLGRERPMTRNVETNTTTYSELLLEKRRENNVDLNDQQMQTVNVTETSQTEEIPKTMTDIVPLNESENFSTSKAVELFNPKNHRKISTQSFQYTKIFDTLKGKTNLNLNINLVKQNLAFPLNLTGPVKVNVSVSVTPIQEDEVARENREILQLEQNSVKKMVKKKVKKPQKNRYIRNGCRYVLLVKNDNNWKLMNKLYSEVVEEFQQEVESDKESSESGSEKDERNIGMRLRSRSQKSIVDNLPKDQKNSSSSDETIFSVDEGSDFSESVYKEIAKTYKFVTVPDDYVTDEEDDYECLNMRKKQRKYENTSHSLLKNMTGMLSPKSKASNTKSGIESKLSDKL